MTDFPIPARLNLALSGLVLLVLTGTLIATAAASEPWQVIACAAIYGIAMNTGYALLHEAEHGILHPRRRINDGIGVVLALFFPAPFHLLRQGHLGHHMRNRSDDEAFDYYFEGESRAWRWLQLYGILTGMFWAAIVLGNVLALAAPPAMRASKVTFDRATAALQESLNPRFDLLIRAEALAAFVLHGSLIAGLDIPVLRYAAVLFGFGFLWSAMQYAHHFATPRDVLYGARNLRSFALLDALWLNHNWHLNHHLRPTVPWVYLPSLSNDNDRGSLLAAYFRMWRGPRKALDRVQNRYAGRIIR